MRFFEGFTRPHGGVGVRNIVAVLPTCGCANDIASRIQQSFGQEKDVVVVSHNRGCGQLGRDREQTVRTLVGIGKNPNISAVLVVGLGCETIQAAELVERTSFSGKPVRSIVALDEGGGEKAWRKGVSLVENILSNPRIAKKDSYGIDRLRVGLKCAHSDTTSGIVSNPAVGRVSDMIVSRGGTVIMAETPESIGAEHILQKRAVDREVGQKAYEMIIRFEEESKAMGVDIRGGNPTPGNIKGGVTTLEEKALGAIRKGGTSRIQGILEYGEAPEGRGLFLMDSPGGCPEVLTGLAAAGCQIILFTTGGGALGASRVCPVVEVTANPRTAGSLKEHIDVDISDVTEGTETLENAAERLFKQVLSVCSGKKTKGELMGYGFTSIWAIGPVV